MLEEFFREKIEINGKILPLLEETVVPDAKYNSKHNHIESICAKYTGFIPMGARTYLKKIGRLDIFEDVVSEVKLRVSQCIKNGSIDPVHDNKEKIFWNLIFCKIIPQAASYIKKNDKLIVTNDKIEIIDGKLYKLINYRQDKQTAKKELLGTLVQSGNDCKKLARKYSFRDKNFVEFDLYVNTSGYITLLAQKCSLIKTNADGNEDEIQIINEDKEIEKIIDESLIFFTCKRVLEIKNEDIFKKLLYILYILELTCKCEKINDYTKIRINTLLLNFIDKPLSHISDYIIVNYLTRYKERLRNSIEPEIYNIKTKTISELARESGNYSGDNVNWRRRINDWRERTFEKFCILCENEYNNSGLLLKYFKNCKEKHFDIAVYIVSRIGQPTFLSIKVLYNKISKENYEGILSIIQIEKIDNQVKSQGHNRYIEQLIDIHKELAKFSKNYGSEETVEEYYGDENALGAAIRKIFRNLHRVLFDELNYYSCNGGFKYESFNR